MGMYAGRNVALKQHQGLIESVGSAMGMGQFVQCPDGVSVVLT